MQYSTVIQNRKSVRAFTDIAVSQELVNQIRTYYQNHVKCLLPELDTKLFVFREDVKASLEGAAGYHQFLVGAPQYMVLLSEKHPMAHLNAGFIMEDLVLNLTDWGVDSCWVTFTDSDAIKDALGIEEDLEVAAIVAFGYGAKAPKRPRINILSMSNVDIKAKRHYVEPKRSVNDMVFLSTWGNSHKVDDYIGFFDDVLWESFYAASLSPSYLNRQAYGFVIHDGYISLVERPDEYNTRLDSELSLGAVMLHFSAVAESWVGRLCWNLGENAAKLQLPAGHRVVATVRL